MTTASTENRQMFDRIVKQYGDTVRRICFMYSNGSSQFDDLYQEAMINIWNGISGFRGDAKISTWIYRTTVNTCISCLRAEKHHTGALNLDEAMTVVTADDDEHRENLMQIYSIVSRLNALDRAIIMMWLDECPYDEIAAVCGMSVPNVATRLHRIKCRIKQIFNSEC